MDIEQRIEEYRAAGWSEAELRDFRKGYESAGTEIRSRPLPAARPQDAGRVTVHDALTAAGGRNRDYERWRKETPAGRLHSLLYPEVRDAYAEVQQTAGPEAVRRVADDREITYGTRPPVGAVREALHHQGWARGQGFAGEAAELQEATRWAFPDFVILNRGEELPGTHQISRPYQDSPQGAAAMRADAAAVRR
jgi:hypothetical protein